VEIKTSKLEQQKNKQQTANFETSKRKTTNNKLAITNNQLQH
jgi:hypothetical protein